MRRMMVGTGWKMNLGIGDSLSYIRELLPKIQHVTEIDVFLIPSFTALAQVGQALTGSRVGFGAQNMFWEERGAFTGEISPLMVRECGCGYVEIGHWERRRMFAETDETVGLKARAAWDHHLIPIICVGEDVRPVTPRGATSMLAAQLTGALGRLTHGEVEQSVLAYEPAWAIGTGKTAAEPNYANAVHGLIRSIVADLFGHAAAEAVRIIYGGSVNLENAPDFLIQPEIDGLFVGRAALDPDVFAKLVKLGVNLSAKK